MLGAFFALLLLLLLLLCCVRRRRKRRHLQSVSAAATGTSASGGRHSQHGGSSRGNYAALGASAGAAGVGAAGAAANRRGSLGSDDWEEDHLSGGGTNSGFFVVGGRRLGSDRHASIASRRSRGSNPSTNRAYPHYTAANFAPSTSSDGAKTTGLAALAAAGAGFLGAAFGRNKKAKDKPRVEIEEEHPFSDDDLGDGSMAERRGLMPFHDSPGSGYGSGAEMREGSPRILGPAAALLGASGAAMYYAGRSGRDGQGADAGSPVRAPFQLGSGATAAGGPRPESGAYSGSGSSSHATGATGSSQTQRAGGPLTISSSRSTGGFTTSGSGTSLPPPPRAPRTSPQTSASTTTYGNVAPSSESPNASGATTLKSHEPRFSTDTTDSESHGIGGMDPAFLTLGGSAALGGLAALAAGHRDSEGSTYSRRNAAPGSDVRASHGSGLSEAELRHLRSTDPERYSRFISAGSNLLGPDYQPSPELEDQASPGVPTSRSSPVEAGTLAAGASAFGRTRLATIPSVSEFGEKSDNDKPAGQSTGNRTAPTQVSSSMHAVSANSGSLGAASSGSRRIVSPLPVYEQQQVQGGESLPDYSRHEQLVAPGTERRRSEGQMSGQYVTPPDSPRNIRRSSEVQRYDDASEGHTNYGDHRPGVQLAETGAASAGILGGMAAGWRRLTMGQYAWIPGTSSPSRGGRQSSSVPRESSDDFDDDLEGRISHDTQARTVSEDSSRLMHPSGRASRFEASEASGLAPEVRSQRASVYGASALGHGTSGSLPAAHTSSKEASGSSGEQARRAGASGVGATAAEAMGSQRQRSYPSLSSQNSSARSRAGYATSHSNSSISGRRARSDSSGLDSLSAVAQLSSRSTGSASTRSRHHSSSGSSSRRTGASLGSGASTGAASYSPSAQLSRDNTTSTRGMTPVDELGPTGDDAYHPSWRSGETASSIVTDAAEAATSEGEVPSSRATGGHSLLVKRKRPRSNNEDGLSRLDSLREDPFADEEGVPRMPAVPPPIGGHYPSDSLGAAVSRSAAQQQQQHAALEDDSRALSQHSRVHSLQPSTSGLAPTALAPALASSSSVDLGHGERSPSTSRSVSAGLSGAPASASWRPSPRVVSASQQAAEAQTALLRAQEQRPAGPRGMLGRAGGPTPPRSDAGSPSVGNRGAWFNWADSSLPRQAHAAQDADASLTVRDDDPDASNRSFGLGKFFHF